MVFPEPSGAQTAFLQGWGWLWGLERVPLKPSPVPAGVTRGGGPEKAAVPGTALWVSDLGCFSHFQPFPPGVSPFPALQAEVALRAPRAWDFWVRFLPLNFGENRGGHGGTGATPKP